MCRPRALPFRCQGIVKPIYNGPLRSLPSSLVHLGGTWTAIENRPVRADLDCKHEAVITAQCGLFLMPVLAIVLLATGHAGLLWLPAIGLLVDSAVLWSGSAWPFDRSR